MQIRALMGRGVFVAALFGSLVAGCGGAEIADSEDGPSLESREDRLQCDGTYIWARRYYSDASYSQLVGERTCDCLGSLVWGEITSFRLTEHGTCSP